MQTILIGSNRFEIFVEIFVNETSHTRFRTKRENRRETRERERKKEKKERERVGRKVGRKMLKSRKTRGGRGEGGERVDGKVSSGSTSVVPANETVRPMA